MSRRLRDIPTSCSMFDNAIKELAHIENMVGEEVWSDIRHHMENVIDYIEDGRTVNGDLRDTCTDIADEKNKEIERLEETLDDKEKEISDLEDRLAEANYQLEQKEI